MNSALIRRVRYPRLDRKVSRRTYQICRKSFMHKLYISRADIHKQWIVISNATDKAVDLSGFSITDTTGNTNFYFPPNYILLSGDEVTVWCSPGLITLYTDNLLQPYLFWTLKDGSLRDAPFFANDSDEAILLDPFMIEIASVQVHSNCSLDYRVRQSRSVGSLALQAIHEIPRCMGYAAKQSRFTIKSTLRWKVLARKVYIFSRYWNIRSELSLWAHNAAILLAPILETTRVLSVLIMWMIVSEVEKNPPLRSSTSILACSVVIFWCDWATRRLCLYIKSGILVSLLSFISLALDHFVNLIMLASLSTLYPNHINQFVKLWRMDTVFGLVNMFISQLNIPKYRAKWPHLLVLISRWDYKLDFFICVCGLGRAALLVILLLLPLGPASSYLHTFGLILTPIYTIATISDFLRGFPGFLWYLQYLMAD